jgi:hypothetical protein
MHEVVQLTRKAWQRKRNVGVHEFVHGVMNSLHGIVKLFKARALMIDD